ncbi:signal peptidase I [Sinomonas sp. ASV322]|uniref:signal peptidase I n=1 Tax=Sinomonas sp. ASV322 TaxID=3041920 RepID=UPI0027DE30BE|nr:signal peptidase I [Sinomonas sp. ASV322]MDQ4501256.1 signal peptidase I [Sinomonas sp. ASV322]
MSTTLDAATALAAPPAVERETRGGAGLKRAARFLARTAIGLVLAAAAAAFLFLAVGPRFLDYQTSTMLTGSMAPLINPGDVVVSVKTPTSALKVGDIITYQIPVQDQRVETHRIATVTREAAGSTIITTKGDANNGPDPWTAVITDNTVYTAAAVVPHLGDAIRVVRSPAVGSALTFGAPSLLVAMLLVSIWRRPAARAAREDRNPGTRAHEGHSGRGK